jgi:Na+/H+-dicarboxylate symporter
MTTARRPWYTVLYIQVLLAIAVGIIIGHFVISRWEGELDVERLNKVMAHPVALGEEFEDQPI